MKNASSRFKNEGNVDILTFSKIADIGITDKPIFYIIQVVPKDKNTSIVTINLIAPVEHELFSEITIENSILRECNKKLSQELEHLAKNRQYKKFANNTNYLNYRHGDISYSINIATYDTMKICKQRMKREILNIKKQIDKQNQLIEQYHQQIDDLTQQILDSLNTIEKPVFDYEDRRNVKV